MLKIHGLFPRKFVHRKRASRGAKKPLDDSYAGGRKAASTLARKRLERAYGMKGQSNFNAEELDELRQIFEFYDIDSSKTMDMSELRMALTALGYKSSDEEIHELASLMDVDGDMTMDFSEFCMIVEFMREEKGMEEELRDAFRCIDEDETGCVTADELLDLLMSQGNTMSLKEASELIRFADKEGNGKLDYNQFIWEVLNGKTRFKSMKSPAETSLVGPSHCSSPKSNFNISGNNATTFSKAPDLLIKGKYDVHTKDDELDSGSTQSLESLERSNGYSDKTFRGKIVTENVQASIAVIGPKSEEILGSVVVESTRVGHSML